MEPGQLRPLHPGAVVRQGEGGLIQVGEKRNKGRPGVEGIRHQLGENRLLQWSGVSVPEVLQEVQQIDPGLTHLMPQKVQGGKDGTNKPLITFPPVRLRSPPR